MEIRGSLIAVYILLLTAVIPLSVIAATDPADLVNELVNLQSQSQSGIIHLDDFSVSRYLTSTKTPRPYHLMVFFDAKQLRDKPELHLQELRQEFSLLSASYIANNPNPNPGIFFCDIEFQQSQSSFGLFGVNSLPHVRLVGPNVKNLKDSEQMDQADFSRMAEAMAEFVESRTKLTVGPIHRPPILSKNQIALVIVAILIWTPFLIKKVLSGGTLLHDWKIWMAGSLFVYFFSVSGAMFNIIRKMPMFLVDRNDPNKLIFFYQGSGMQLGAEGFAIGFLYTIVGLLLAFITHVLVYAKNVTTQRVVMIMTMLVSFWAVSKVIYLDNWKTGYGVHAFWPSGW